MKKKKLPYSSDFGSQRFKTLEAAAVHVRDRMAPACRGIDVAARARRGQPIPEEAIYRDGKVVHFVDCAGRLK